MIGQGYLYAAPTRPIQFPTDPIEWPATPITLPPSQLSPSDMRTICNTLCDEFDIMRALNKLPKDAQQRVLEWLQTKLGGTP